MKAFRRTKNRVWEARSFVCGLWSVVWGLSGSAVRPRFLVNGHEKRPNP
jgi:hypothetical protein